MRFTTNLFVIFIRTPNSLRIDGLRSERNVLQRFFAVKVLVFEKKKCLMHEFRNDILK